jgi:hypothetical protein
MSDFLIPHMRINRTQKVKRLARVSIYLRSTVKVPGGLNPITRSGALKTNPTTTDGEKNLVITRQEDGTILPTLMMLAPWMVRSKRRRRKRTGGRERKTRTRTRRSRARRRRRRRRAHLALTRRKVSNQWIQSSLRILKVDCTETDGRRLLANLAVVRQQTMI